MKPTEIRTLTGSDHTATVKLLGVLNPDVPEVIIRERLDTILRDHPNYQIVGAFNGDRLVGVCGAWIATKIWCGKFLEIDNLVVEPDARSSGIGAHLIEHFEAIARENKCTVLTLDSYADNKRSHRLYERLGFEPWGIHSINPIGNWTGGETP
jgi:ribosomal protein S18 acetylase RimI-like enzyme